MITRTREMNENGGFKETLTEEQSSGELSMNAKGAIQWNLKVYKDDPEEWKKTANNFLMAMKEAKDNAMKIGL